jgi:hypothetical protein
MKQFNKITIKTKDKEVINFITYTIPNYNKGEYVEIKGTLYKIVEVLHFLVVSDDKTKVDTSMEILVKEKGKWF